MTPPGPVFAQFSRRQNRKKMLEQLRVKQEQMEIDQIGRETEIDDIVTRAVESGFPKQLADILKAQMLGGPRVQMMQVPTDEEWHRNEMQQVADRFVATFIDRDVRGQITMYDFEKTLAGARKLLIVPTSTTYPEVEIFLDDGGKEIIDGRAADALIRYLHFLGIFELEEAKEPCPNCGDKEPQDCSMCGGIGWVIE